MPRNGDSRASQLRSEARRWLPPERQAALDATEANVDALGEQLRRLHREQGGLQLPMCVADRNV